jgi:hypothetical protein
MLLRRFLDITAYDLSVEAKLLGSLDRYGDRAGWGDGLSL